MFFDTISDCSTKLSKKENLSNQLFRDPAGSSQVKEGENTERESEVVMGAARDGEEAGPVGEGYS